jgi:hypothetical protein
LLECRDLGQHVLRVAALIEIADQHKMRLCRLLDPAFAIGERGVDIGAAPQLHAEQHLQRIGQLLSEVRSKIAVSKHTSLVEITGSEAMTAAKIEA